MAPINSSSKRKSSASHKKKRSKSSSEAGKRRKSKSRRRSKSKKHCRCDASISCSKDDLRTEDSISVSSSDSEDEYRSRRARSRTRGNAKGSKKRARHSSSSREVDRDSPNRRKRKGLKRNRGSDERKNSSRKNHRRSLHSKRDANVSSPSSGSRSCSTCHGSSSDGGRSKGRLEERDRYKRSPSKVSIGRYKNRYRSKSCSSCSACDNSSGYRSEERYAGEKYSPRLKSVLTVMKQSKEREGNRDGRDDDRTEIIQAYDDCPSCRSNESYDGGRKRESSYHPHGASDKKRRVDDAKGEGTSKIKTTEIIGSGKENDGAQYDGNDQNLSMVGSTKTSTRSRNELPSATGTSEGGDLELYLRQKALENLKKFRGGRQTNTKALQKEESGDDGKLPSIPKIETVPNEPPKEDRSKLLGATQVVSQNVTPSMERESNFYPPKDVLIPDKRHESTIKLDNVHSVKGVGNMTLNRAAVTSKLSEKNKPNVGINGNTRQESSGDQSNLKEAPTSKESPMEKLLEARNISNRSVITNLKTSLGSSNTHGATISESRSAASIPNTATTTEHCIPDKIHESTIKLDNVHSVKGVGNMRLNRTAVTSKLSEKNKPNVGINGNTRQESSGDQSNLKEAPTSKESPKEKLLEARNISNRSVLTNLKTSLGSSNTRGAAICESRLAASIPNTATTAEHCRNEQQDETKGSSQFEQKTMSVMRGGQMVQVSYKVYIPKKTPALARRQLQR